MKVLLLSLHHPELLRGGAQQVCYELFQGLQARADVTATLLCAIDPSFPALYKSGARIVGFDGRRDEFLFLTRGYDYLWHRLADRRLIEAFAEFLTLVKPDVVHFHHFLLFGFELVSVTRRVLPHARIVFTLHEFLVICDANGHMVRRNDKSLCANASSGALPSVLSRARSRAVLHARALGQAASRPSGRLHHADPLHDGSLRRLGPSARALAFCDQRAARLQRRLFAQLGTGETQAQSLRLFRPDGGRKGHPDRPARRGAAARRWIH